MNVLVPEEETIRIQIEKQVLSAQCVGPQEAGDVTLIRRKPVMTIELVYQGRILIRKLEGRKDTLCCYGLTSFKPGTPFRARNAGPTQLTN